MKQFQVLSSPRLCAMATTRTSMVLLVPRVVGAEMVSASPTLTPSFSAWFSKIRIVPGLRQVVELAARRAAAPDANSGSLRDVDAGDAELHRAGVGDDLGPAAPAVDRERPSPARPSAHDLQHLLVVGDDRRRLPRRHLEEAAHVDVAGRQRGGGVDHGLAHAGRQAVSSTSSAVTAAMAAPRNRRAAAVLHQVAERDREIDAELGHGYSSSCIAWRGVTRIASQAG